MASNMMLSKKKDILLLWYTLLPFKYIFKLQRNTISVYTASGLFIAI